MTFKNARIACTALAKRIMLGNVTNDGLSFTSTKRDVTSDCLKAVIEFVGDGNEATVTVGGKAAYTITVKAIAQPVQQEVIK